MVRTVVKESVENVVSVVPALEWLLNDRKRPVKIIAVLGVPQSTLTRIIYSYEVEGDNE